MSRALKRHRSRKYKGVYTSNALFLHMHFVNDYNAITTLLRDTSAFAMKGASPVFEALFGIGQLQEDGPEHLEARNKLKHAFSPKVFPAYMKVITRRADEALGSFSKAVEANGRGLLDPTIRELYLSIIVEIVSGISKESEFFSEIRERFARVQGALFSPPFGPMWDDALKARDEMRAIVDEVVRRSLVEDAEKIERLRQYGNKISSKGARDISQGDVCVMDISNANEGLNVGAGAENDPESIFEQTKLFVGLWFAGFATSAATTSCALFEMGQNPDIWEALAAEQDDIVEQAGGERAVSYDQLGQMPLLESFINEILRTRPVAIGVPRKVVRDVEVFGKRLEAGSTVFFDFADAMLDERYYPEPFEVKVDRFQRKEGAPSAPRVLTFGAPGSAHYCLGYALAGLLMKTTLSMILRGYTVEMDKKQSRRYTVLPEIVPVSKVAVSAMRPRKFGEEI